MTLPDWRLNAFRADLASAALRGRVEAARFVDGAPAHVVAPSALLRRRPDWEAPVDSELIFGEQVSVFDQQAGWSWVQNTRDDYVGYVQSDTLKPGPLRPTHKVAVARTPVFSHASIKTGERGWASLNAPVVVDEVDGQFARLADGAGYIFGTHLARPDKDLADLVDTARLFLHAPYRWGGRTSLGLDCSGLVQMVLWACGFECPRDTDMQERALGVPAEEDVDRLQRGDLIFWKGHVGFVSAPGMLLHATGHFMLVVEEPLRAAVDRIAGQGLAVTAVKRIQ